MFASAMLPEKEMRRAVAERLRPKMFRDGAWTIDYRRLRISARTI
jgi:hypothetical protein